MNISIIGAGYVGLTTAACLSELGHQVVCAESDTEKLRLLGNGQIPFYEPHLGGIIRRGRAEGRLQFATTEEAVTTNSVIFICVGTPALESGEADLSSIDTVARTIARTADGYRLVIEKSTVPVQTGHQLHKSLALYGGRQQYDIASNPEFLREGSAVEDFFHPDRIVVGVESPAAEACLHEIYQPILDQRFLCPVHAAGCGPRKEVPLVVTDVNSAELIKHASNSFLAMKISFINLVADLCEAAGADVAKVAQGIGLDRRIGRAFLRPGIGFGGSCFPKDLQAFVHVAGKLGCDFSLLEEVERVNRRRVDLFVEKLKKELWVLRGKTICVWGLAYKANTDDVRYAPALEIIRRLVADGALIKAYDPQAMEKARAQLPSIEYCADPYEAAKGASAVLALTEWNELREVDWKRLAGVVEWPLILDGRNMFRVEEVTSNGFGYVGIGCSADRAPLSGDREEALSQRIPEPAPA